MLGSTLVGKEVRRTQGVVSLRYRELAVGVGKGYI